MMIFSTDEFFLGVIWGPSLGPELGRLEFVVQYMFMETLDYFFLRYARDCQQLKMLLDC